MRPMLMMLPLALLATSCSDTPAVTTKTATPGYESDLEGCSDAAGGAVNKQNAKTGHAWFLSPVTRWSQIADGRDACMQAKGWGRTRACTADELRAGNRTAGLAVSANGVRCTDPATNLGRPR